MLLYPLTRRSPDHALGNYGQIYGQLGAVIVFMLWLYVTALMVLLGLEINAVLARMAEERKGIELVQTD